MGGRCCLILRGDRLVIERHYSIFKHPVMPLSHSLSDFTAHGFTLVPGVLTDAECAALASRLADLPEGSAGTRDLLSSSWCRALASQVRQHPSLQALIPSGFVAVQCTYFEKSPSRNWLVPVHQDLSIPVAARVAHPDLGGWSEKEGALYVQAPVELLQELIAVRIHIDECSAEDGPLRVVPGSHLAGQINAGAAALARQSGEEFICTARRGTALAMRPLLLHSSSRSQGKGPRRVLHFLFGPQVLPFGLQWQNPA
jgi:hypothetical protein